ncbi:MAG: hypothetical protein PUD38_06210 [Firmicutes bacterium]|nr:hypothetical protein [Bacillota bacterium]
MKSARADSETFYFLRKFGKSRNTVCISDFQNCTEEAKDSLLSRRRFIQRFPGNKKRGNSHGESPQPFFCVKKTTKIHTRGFPMW